MQPRNDFADDRELQPDLQSQPIFADGTLKFVRRLSATHSQLSEYSFQSGSGIKSLIVKQQAAGSAQAILQEFENLGRARSLLAHELEQSVPEPLLALLERRILVTGKVPGIPLTMILKKYANILSGPFRTSALCETARQAGKWLRSFQSATQGEPLIYSAASYLTDLEQRLSKFPEKGFEPGLAREILQQASLHTAPLNGRLISAAARHGDFIAQNILIEDRTVAVVDFEGFSERAPVYDDLGMFLGYLFVLGAHALYSSRSLDSAGRAFLAGFLAGDEIDRPLLNTYILKGAVRIISDGPPLAKNWTRLSTAWMLTKRLKNLASAI
jgi:hypothetical protein